VSLCLLVSAYTLPPDKLARAIEYARERNRLYFVAVAYGIAILVALLFAKLAPRYRDWAGRVTRVHFLQAYLFAFLLLFTIDLLELPVGMRYHWLAVKYGQSIQPWGSWLSDLAIGECLNLAVGGLLVWLFYCIARRSPRRWWFYGWLGAIPLIVFSVFIYPLAVDPLFYTYTPLSKTHPEVVAQLEKVTVRAGLEIPRDRIFEMNASSKLKSVNALVTGVGASKRVVVWDNTMRTMTTAQTLFIFGHEMGHYVMHHIWIGIGLSVLGLLVGLYATYYVLARLGVPVDDFASLPALLLAMALFDFVSTPIGNAISRMEEHDADVYGLEVIHGIVADPRQAASQAFQIMGEIALADPSPSPFIEFWLYSHPSVSSRVRFASEYDPWQAGQRPKYVPF
jgi:Zn-dependent protease with chaperone function